MADSSKPKSGGGCLQKLVVLFLLVMGAGLGTAVFFVSQAQDLSDIGGYGPMSRGASGRDLNAVMKQSIQRGHVLNLSEMEINQWIARTISVKQGGLLGGQVSLERVWVRLLDGYAEIIMERKVMGRPFTVSMFLTIEQVQEPRNVRTTIDRHGGPYLPELPHPKRGGRFGKLVVPQGFLYLVVSEFDKLAEALAPEKELVEGMARIRIEKNRLVLDPRGPSGNDSGLPDTF